MLGWLGGATVLLGLIFLLVIAASHGWIGEGARVLMAGAGSLALLAGGVRMRERRGGAEAALAAAATGIAGLFATTVVAGPVYGLIPALPALALALATGGAATALALRWSAPGIAWLGILGALASPALVGALGAGAGVAPMLVAYGAAAAVLLWQRWHALAFAAFLVAVPQLAAWLYAGAPAPAAIAALAVFGLVTAAAAAGFELRARSARLRVSASVLLGLNALAVATLGVLALGADAAPGWLAALAAAHAAAGVLARRSTAAGGRSELGLVLLTLGVVVADVAFAAVADGLPLVAGWAAGAVACSALARAARRTADEAVALTGLGGHLLLALATALTGVVPLDAVWDGGGDPALAAPALATLAAAAWAAARLVEPRRPELRIGLDAVALAAVAVLSAVLLDGAALTLALAGEAVALGALARQRRDPLPLPAAAAFLGVALGHALVVLAPPEALVGGLEAVLPAIAGLGAVSAAAGLLARAATRDADRGSLAAASALVALYLASVLVVTPFQPGAETAALPLELLDVRQQGQALLSALWALAGVGGLLAGLVTDRRALRLGALALIGVAAAKVFLIDLASLTSLYRVGSCLALGLLLLAGSFAWQRMRGGLVSGPAR